MENLDTEEYETEEFIVYADFGSNLLSKELYEPDLDVKVIGIETENPIMEINGKVYKGKYDFSIGTHCLFEVDDNPSSLDPPFNAINPSTMYKYFTKTNKVLYLDRLLVENRQNTEEENKPESIEEKKSRLEVNMTYGEALNLLLPPGSKPPRQISPEDNNDNNGSTVDFAEEEYEDNQKNRKTLKITEQEMEDDPDYIPHE